MTTSFIKFSTIRPGTRHGAVVELPKTPALAQGSFRALSPSLFELSLADGSTSVLAIVHGSLCTESKAPQGALVPGLSEPKRFARYGAIKASTRYLKNFEIADSVLPVSAGSFRFVEAGTVELTFANGEVNVVLIARGYLYAEVKQPTDALTGLIGASIGAEEEPVDVNAAAAAAK